MTRKAEMTVGRPIPENAGRPLRVAFAGDRDIAVQVLTFVIEQGVRPAALLVAEKERATHAKELVALCGHLDSSMILEGNRFRTQAGVRLLRGLDLDYILSIHFPYIYSKEVLAVPMRGVLNLHPAYLPYNRGWHTASWAIWEGTPYGATLHFVDEGIDSGDIVLQERMEIRPDDTADTLYKRAKRLELDVFKKAWPNLLDGSYARRPQSSGAGTVHKKADLAALQLLNLDKRMKAGDLVRLMRALTTNNVQEGCYFEANGSSYRMQVRIVKEKKKS